MKVKPQKDPDAPKKPQTAYFIFLNKKRQIASAEDKKLTFGELTKKLTEMWKALVEDERRVYEDMAVADKERY